MLYEEFLKGTGCKNTDYNYKVYKNLEELYINNESLTKTDVYEVGKKLIDNSLTEEEKKTLADIEEKINNLDGQIKEWKCNIIFLNELIERHTQYLEIETEEEKKEERKNLKYWKDQKRMYKNWIKEDKADINKYKLIADGIK